MNLLPHASRGASTHRILLSVIITSPLTWVSGPDHSETYGEAAGRLSPNFGKAKLKRRMTKEENA